MIADLQDSLEAFSLHKNEEDCFFLEHNNTFFSISRFMYEFIKTVIKFRDDRDIIQEMNFAPEEYHFVCQNVKRKLVEITTLKPKRTLSLKITLFKRGFVTLVTDRLQFLMPASIAAFLLVLSVLLASFVFLLHLYVRDRASISTENLDIMYIYASVILTSISHEFGHATATKKFKKDPGDIGMGLFFIFPVFYSDVTHIWTLEKRKRIIVNLSGLYFQLLFCAMITFLFFEKTGFIANYLLINISIITFSFIPFIKTDGYWVLSDLFDRKNLFENANKYLIGLLLGRKKFDLFYFIYSALHFTFIVYLLFMFFGMIRHEVAIFSISPFSCTNSLKLLFHFFISFFLIKSFVRKLTFKRL